MRVVTIALAFLLVGLGTVVFHLMSPWGETEIASNWGMFDLTIDITFWITGVVWIVIMAFITYCIFKFHNRPGHTAHYEPESGKLETLLVIGTAVGVVALLTPGLFAWADYVTVPDDATEVEVLGEQWKWTYRYPGDDGIMGTSEIRHVSFENPFGIDPDDAHGQDDIVVASSTLRVALHKPVKFLLRSKDVLHNFYVPEFRAKMDLVPGMVTFIWVEPIRTGEFEVLCFELCGEGHWNMRGHIVVEEQAAYDAWLAEQPTFAETQAQGPAEDEDPMVARGREVAQSNGCLGCHSVDGAGGVGPTWLGLFGKTETLEDGETVVVDDAFLIESIVDPNATVIEGFPAAMPPYQLSDEDNAALVAFIKSLTE